MDHLKIIVCLYVISACSSSVIHQNVEEKFTSFVKRHGKHYEIGSEEYDARIQIFVKNIETQKVLNQNRTHNASAFYGITKFSDLSDWEFREKFLRPFNTSNMKAVKARPLLFQHPGSIQKNVAIPDKVDWRNKNVVTAVQNQKSCGSCWAFAVTETIESAYALSANGSLIDLSEQEMMDCSNGYQNALHGCSGGDTCTALNWMSTTKTKLVTESAYPVTDKQQACQLQPSAAKGVGVVDSTCDDFSQNEDRLLAALTKGPVSAALDAATWNNYLGGIIQFHCGSVGLNHAVEIVGYDKTAEIPHYIAKNSWGTDWGDNGYVYIKIGGDVCRVASRVSQVTTCYNGN